MGYLIDTCTWIDVERGLLFPSDAALHTGNDSAYISDPEGIKQKDPLCWKDYEKTIADN